MLNIFKPIDTKGFIVLRNRLNRHGYLYKRFYGNEIKVAREFEDMFKALQQDAELYYRESCDEAILIVKSTYIEDSVYTEF